MHLALGLVLGALLFWIITQLRGQRRAASAGQAALPATVSEQRHVTVPPRNQMPVASMSRVRAVPEVVLSDYPPASEDHTTRLYGAAQDGSPKYATRASLRPYAREARDDVEGQSDSHVVVCYEEEAEEEETTSPLARILVSAKGESDPGRKRSANHDSLLFVPEFSLYAVADGMGGAAGGQASSLAVETLRQAFERESFVGDLRSEKPIPRRGRELASSILQANWAVFNAARENPVLSDIGTTLVTARFSPNKQRLYIGHVGDSRCYRLRAGKLRQLTTDHTMGVLGLRGPRSKDLLQAIGVTEDLSIDLIVDKPRSDDLYLLCSDGLPKMASDSEIERVLIDEPDLDAAVHALIDLANDNGGTDNVTVVLVKVIERVFKPALIVPSAEARRGSARRSRKTA